MAVSPAPFPGPGPRLRWHRYRKLGRPTGIPPPGRQSGQRPGCSRQPYPRSGSSVPAYHGHPPPDAVCCSAPFCAPHGLIASNRSGPMWMQFDMRGVDHQPLQVRVIDHLVQQVGPDAPVPPATETAMGVLPVPIVRWQVPPRRSSAQVPKYRVQKQAVVPGGPPPLANSPRQMGLQTLPNLVRNVVPPMRWRHTSTPHLIPFSVIYHL